jgi:hypothetical protein
MAAVSPGTTVTGGTGWGTDFWVDRYLNFVLIAVDLCALGLLIVGQHVTKMAEAYTLIYLSYGLLAVAMAAFLRVAVLVRRGRGGGPDPSGWGTGGGGRGPKRSIILALILATLAIILIFTNVYYLANAPAYLSPALKDTWQQTMSLAVGVLCTVQSPPLLVSWAGVAAVIQELTDLVFLGGVVTIALSRV